METVDSGEGEARAPQQEVVLRSPFERKRDVFDAEDFDAVKLINKLYPDGEAGHGVSAG